MDCLEIPLCQVITLPDDHVKQADQIQAVIPGYARLPANVIQDDTFLIPEKLPLTPTKRIVVLVPQGEFSEEALSRRVWQLANLSGYKVLYLAKLHDGSQISYYQLRLANLVMMTTCGYVRSRSSISTVKNWSEAVKRVLQPGDILLCFANHKASPNLIWRIRLGDQIARTVCVPIYMLGGLKIGPPPERKQAIKQILAWMASLALVIAFFFLQVSIVNSTTKPLGVIITSFSILIEGWMLLKVNEWIG